MFYVIFFLILKKVLKEIIQDFFQEIVKDNFWGIIGGIPRNNLMVYLYRILWVLTLWKIA